MKRIAFGPRTGRPSWEWVGAGTAAELGRYFHVETFDGFDRVPTVDLIVVVKVRPPDAFVAAARGAGVRLAWVPIDGYFSAAAIEADAAFLRACDLVVLHSAELLALVAPHCRRTALVEHHARHALEELADFRPSGFVLWVGGCEHVVHVVRWLDGVRPPFEVRLLTNLNDKAARIQAHVRAHDLGVRLAFGDGTINGYPAFQWSDSLQRTFMRECRASIDIKGADFNQVTKPPTKAQQFVASGIPFGCNLDSSIARYFERRGFRVASADDFDRLLSRGYWEETRVFARALRSWTSLEAVGQAYKQSFEAIMSTATPDIDARDHPPDAAAREVSLRRTI